MIFTDEEKKKLDSRDGFLMPKSLFPLLDVMNMEERGITLTAITNLVRTGEIMAFKVERSFPKVALDEFIRQSQRDQEKYINTSRRNKENADKRWKDEREKEAQNK